MRLIARGVLRISNLSKEGAQYIAAFMLHEPGVEPRLVVEPPIFEQVHQAAAAAGFGIRGAVVDLLDTGENDRARAHGAGFERDVKARALEPPALEVGGGLRDGEDFGVGGGVLEDLALVVGLADDLAVMDDNAADGHLAGLAGLLGLAEGALHISRIFVKHVQGFWSAGSILSNGCAHTSQPILCAKCARRVLRTLAFRHRHGGGELH